jgi:GxxExxY protein
MNQGGSKIIHKGLSYRIIGLLFDVYNDLGYGYKEKHYERAIEKCFKENGLVFTNQAPYKVSVKGEVIGRQYIDFIVENKIVVEIKRGNYFSKNNIKQVKCYLKVTGLKLGIIVNFTSNGVKFFRVLNPDNINAGH